MIDFNIFSNEVFQILRSYEKNIVMYDDTGARVFEPAEARRLYVIGDNLLISIVEDGDNSSLKLYLSPSFNLQQVKGLLDTLRTAAVQYNLLFHVKKYNKEIKPKDFAVQSAVNEHQESQMNIMEGLYGTSKSSYLKLENARMIVRHNARINERMIGARGRHISAIFVENQEGERFRFPVNMLSGARAMTQHVSNGGTFADEVGSQIIRMAQDFGNLAKVTSHINSMPGISDAVKGKSAANESIAPVLNWRTAILESMRGLKRSFDRVYESRTYMSETAKIVSGSALMEDNDTLTETIDTLVGILGEGIARDHLSSVARLVTVAESNGIMVEDDSMIDDSTDLEESDMIIMTYKCDIPEDAIYVHELSQIELTDMIFDKFVEEQSIVTIEGVDVKGNSVFLFPHFGDVEPFDPVIQAELNAAFTAWCYDLDSEFDHNMEETTVSVNVPGENTGVCGNHPAIREFNDWMESFNPDAMFGSSTVNENTDTQVDETFNGTLEPGDTVTISARGKYFGRKAIIAQVPAKPDGMYIVGIDGEQRQISRHNFDAPSLMSVNDMTSDVMEDESTFDSNASQSAARPVMAALDKQFGGYFATQLLNDGSVKFIQNGGSSTHDESNPSVLSPRNLSKVIDQFFGSYRAKGWTFTQPSGGSFIIGVPDHVVSEDMAPSTVMGEYTVTGVMGVNGKFTKRFNDAMARDEWVSKHEDDDRFEITSISGPDMVDEGVLRVGSAEYNKVSRLSSSNIRTTAEEKQRAKDVKAKSDAAYAAAHNKKVGKEVSEDLRISSLSKPYDGPKQDYSKQAAEIEKMNMTVSKEDRDEFDSVINACLNMVDPHNTKSIAACLNLLSPARVERLVNDLKPFHYTEAVTEAFDVEPSVGDTITVVAPGKYLNKTGTIVKVPSDATTGTWVVDIDGEHKNTTRKSFKFNSNMIEGTYRFGYEKSIMEGSVKDMLVNVTEPGWYAFDTSGSIVDGPCTTKSDIDAKYTSDDAYTVQYVGADDLSESTKSSKKSLTEGKNTRYEITKTKDNGREYKQEGTLEELIKAYSYTLDVGASYSHEKGNAKINQNPKNIASLVKNLNNAANNSAANGYAGVDYTSKVLADKVSEAKNEDGDSEYATYAGWKKAAKAKNSDVWFDGDADIGQAMVGVKPFKAGSTHAIGEWDGEKGCIFKSAVTEALGDSDPKYQKLKDDIATAKKEFTAAKKANPDLSKNQRGSKVVDDAATKLSKAEAKLAAYEADCKSKKIDEAQSPAQKAAFAKMLAAKKGKAPADKKDDEEVKEGKSFKRNDDDESVKGKKSKDQERKDAAKNKRQVTESSYDYDATGFNDYKKSLGSKFAYSTRSGHIVVCYGHNDEVVGLFDLNTGKETVREHSQVIESTHTFAIDPESGECRSRFLQACDDRNANVISERDPSGYVVVELPRQGLSASTLIQHARSLGSHFEVVESTISESAETLESKVARLQKEYVDCDDFPTARHEIKAELDKAKKELADSNKVDESSGDAVDRYRSFGDDEPEFKRLLDVYDAATGAQKETARAKLAAYFHDRATAKKVNESIKTGTFFKILGESELLYCKSVHGSKVLIADADGTEKWFESSTLQVNPKSIRSIKK